MSADMSAAESATRIRQGSARLNAAAVQGKADGQIDDRWHGMALVVSDWMGFVARRLEWQGETNGLDPDRAAAELICDALDGKDVTV